MNNTIREITDKALSGLIGIVAGVAVFYWIGYPLILKLAGWYNGQK